MSDENEPLLFERGEPLLKRGLDLYREALDSGIRVSQRWEVLVGALAVRSYNSLAVAANLIVDYPIQAIMLARASFEAILIADHVTAHPDDQRFWMDPKYDDSQRRRVPGFAAMLRHTDSEDLLN